MLGNDTIMSFVATSDYKKAKDFYVDILGLKFIEQQEFAMVLDSNGIMVRVSKTPDFSPAPFTVLGWKVKDIAKKVEALTEKGVRFELYSFLKQDALAIWTSPDGAKVAWFKDPDGNVLSLAEFN